MPAPGLLVRVAGRVAAQAQFTTWPLPNWCPEFHLYLAQRKIECQVPPERRIARLWVSCRCHIHHAPAAQIQVPARHGKCFPVRPSSCPSGLKTNSIGVKCAAGDVHISIGAALAKRDAIQAAVVAGIPQEINRSSRQIEVANSSRAATARDSEPAVINKGATIDVDRAVSEMPTSMPQMKFAWPLFRVNVPLEPLARPSWNESWKKVDAFLSTLSTPPFCVKVPEELAVFPSRRVLPLLVSAKIPNSG